MFRVLRVLSVPRVLILITAAWAALIPLSASAGTGWVWTTPGTVTYWTYHEHRTVADQSCGGLYNLGVGDSVSNNGSSLTFNDFRVYSYSVIGSYPAGGTLWIQDTKTGNAEDWLDLYEAPITSSTQTIYTNWTAQADSSNPPYVQFNSFAGGTTSPPCSGLNKVVYYP